MKKLSIIFLLLGLLACQDEGTAESPFYLEYKMDGKDYQYNDGQNKDEPWFSDSKSWGSSPPHDTIYMEYRTVCHFNGYNSYPNFEIEFNTHAHKSLTDSLNGGFKNYEDFKDLFILGEKQFTASPCSYSLKGIVIRYTDEDNIVWCTSKYPCGSIVKPVNPNYDQFSYNIISSEEYIYHYLEKRIEVNSTFNCTLYNVAGDSIIIENGQMSSFFEF